MKKDIYSTLRKRIIQGQYEQGEIIREVDIAKEFQVSRTPVREVFQNLQNDKLIILLPYRGAQVTYIELEFFFQTAAVKRNLEEMATRLAARWATDNDIRQMREIVEKLRNYDPEKDFESFEMYLELDTQFHRTVWQASRNGLLVDLLEELQAHIDRYYYYSRHTAARTMESFQDEFCEIIRAIEAHDQDWAGTAIRTHIDGYYEVIRATYIKE